MSTDRDTTRIVRSWLRSDEHESADRVLDAVLDRLDTTPQRRATRWPARRFPEMNSFAKFGIAAAAVAIAALLGFNYLVAPNIGGPGLADPTPTALPTPTPAPLEQQEGTLAPGSYAIDDVLPLRITVTVPAGWQKNVNPAQVWTANSEAHLAFATVDNVYVDPCAAAPVLRDPAVGPTVDELVAALEDLPNLEVSAPTDVTVAGFAGKQLELTAPDGSCSETRLWDLQPLNDAGPVEDHLRIWILDVNGERLVIGAQDRAGASTSDLDDMQAMVDSVRIGP